ncbi:MAG: glycosyltransferase family 2 [uncultured bacterium]|nr:MAG: glycosyltransferase family 2 [uncultured bacterium]
MHSVNAVIINYNTKDLADQCIASLSAELKIFSSSLITVIDNASKDGSAELIKRKYPEVNLISNDSNMGFGRAANKAVQLSPESLYVLFVNTDTLPENGIVKKMYDYMEVNKNCGILSPRLLNEDLSYQNSVANWPSLYNEILGKRLCRLFFPAKYLDKTKEINTPIKVESVVGAFFMIRFECLKEVKGFDERYFFFLEETDLCRKMMGIKKDVIFNPFISIVHLQGASANKNKIWSRHNFFRSKYQFLKEWDGNFVLYTVYFKNFTVTFIKTLVYFIAACLFLFMNPEINQKLKVAAWLFVNHFKGFPSL